MATEFSREFFADNRIVKAELRSARKPREEELNRIRAEVRKLYDATEVILNVTVDESLLSGYVLQVGDRVFDNSGRHQLDKMMEGKPSLATLKTRIETTSPPRPLPRAVWSSPLRWHRARRRHEPRRVRRDRHLRQRCQGHGGERGPRTAGHHAVRRS